MILGIDLGSSTTKLVLMDGERIVEKQRIPHGEPVEPIIRKMGPKKIEKIRIVGAGASFIEGNILDIPTERVTEFKAIAKGGAYLSGLSKCLVVSLGTGTAFVHSDGENSEHAGGTGMGGASLVAFARYGLQMEDAKEFMELAENGDIHRAELLIGDISKTDIGSLFANATAANMAKIDKDSRPEDYAFGVCNMIFQNIAVMAVMADRPWQTGKIVVMTSVGQTAFARRCFKEVGELYHYDFLVPEDSVFGVAIGAVLA